MQENGHHMEDRKINWRWIITALGYINCYFPPSILNQVAPRLLVIVHFNHILPMIREQKKISTWLP